eukprot:4430-Heterococcus_DN1.PRE.1
MLLQWMGEVETLGARAAWVLGQWDDLDSYVKGDHMQKRRAKSVGLEGALFLEAVLAVQRGELETAQACIDDARRAVAPVLASMLRESYSRAYGCMVTVQELSELEEVVQHKAALAALSIDSKYTTATSSTATSTISSAAANEEAARLRTLRAKWSARLQWVPEDTDVWRRILSVRSLVFAPKQVSAMFAVYGSLKPQLSATVDDLSVPPVYCRRVYVLHSL